MRRPKPTPVNPISIDFCSEISIATSTTTASPPPTPPPNLKLTLIRPSQRRKHSPKPKVYRAFRSAFLSLPIISPSCKFPVLHGGLPDSRVTGTLFGYRKAKVTFSIQENPRCLPSHVIQLAIQTNVLRKEMSSGTVRIVLECDKQPAVEAAKDGGRVSLLEEPVWTMYCNGKKTGLGLMREATAGDLKVMEVLKAVSMGAGALPRMAAEVDGPEGEMAYIRAHYDHVVGSKDSETLHMLGPEGNGAELSIFFVRI